MTQADRDQQLESFLAMYSHHSFLCLHPVPLEHFPWACVSNPGSSWGCSPFLLRSRVQCCYTKQHRSMVPRKELFSLLSRFSRVVITFPTANTKQVEMLADAANKILEHLRVL